MKPHEVKCYRDYLIYVRRIAMDKHRDDDPWLCIVNSDCYVTLTSMGIAAEYWYLKLRADIREELAGGGSEFLPSVWRQRGKYGLENTSGYDSTAFRAARLEWLKELIDNEPVEK